MPGPQVDEEIKREIQRIFAPQKFVGRVFFPKQSSHVPDRPVITFLITDLDQTMEDERATRQFAEAVIREYGANTRRFKSSLIWVVPDSAQSMRDKARKVLAWQAIQAEDLKLDEAQNKQLAENIHRAKRDLEESIWRAYKYVFLLDKDDGVKIVDLGLVHSSAADTPIFNILNRLSTDGDVEKGISPRFLVKHWPPAFEAWPTKAVREAPAMPHLYSRACWMRKPSGKPLCAGSRMVN